MRTYRLLTTLLAPATAWLLQRRRQRVPLKFSPRDFSALKNPGTPPKKAPVQPLKRPIWLHCASAGEVVAAQPLIEALQKTQRPLLVSLWSPNGAIKLQQLFGDTIPWTWLPWDAPRTMRQFVDVLQPEQLWIMETEIWPNMLLAAQRAGVPTLYINGRLTDKTLHAPRWLKKAYQTGLRHVDKVLARSAADAERFAQLGVATERIEVAGNLKWVAATQLTHAPPPPLRNAPYHLFASIYREEAATLLPRLAAQRSSTPWVLVPRRPEQDAQHLAELAQAAGLRPALIHQDQQARTTTADLLIETRFGTLTRWIAAASTVIMGGSFAPYGGHNFLEAAALGKPIILGPHMEDFAEETALFHQAGTLIQTPSIPAALQAVNHLPAQLGEQAQHLLQQHAGAIIKRYTDSLGL